MPLLLGLIVSALGVPPDPIEPWQEGSIHYLQKRACMTSGIGGWIYTASTVTPCLSDEHCPAIGSSCEHRSLIEDPVSLYPPLATPNVPALECVWGTPEEECSLHEGMLRYVPLCDDGTGDHEYSVSGGELGVPPLCAEEEYIRCANGVRPFYRVAPGTTNNWLIHAGGGGHQSAPGDDTSIWASAHAEASSYSVTTTPANRGDLTGIFDDLGPFADYNRVWIEKCTPDRWLGNRSYDGSNALVEGTEHELPVGTLAPPPSDGNAYHVYYHGKRIIRAVLQDIGDDTTGGIWAWDTYPLVDADEDLLPDPQAGDVWVDGVADGSLVLLHCHSNGCNGLQGGHIDDIHAWYDLGPGDVDVRALFNSFAYPGPEVEQCVSEMEDVGPPPDGHPDLDPVIDDTCSTYDHDIDTVSITGQDLSLEIFEPGGTQPTAFEAWYDASPTDYYPPVDASCLADHCPAAGTNWASDADCTPCMESIHVMMNHLSTPFFYNQAQFDEVLAGEAGFHCLEGGVPSHCDYEGAITGVDVSEDFYRKAIRKQFADLYRYGVSERCEFDAVGAGTLAVGSGTYDHMLLVLPNWGLHNSLSDPALAAEQLNPAGSTPDTSLAGFARMFADSSSPMKAVCMQYATVGENGSGVGGDFQNGALPGCQ